MSTAAPGDISVVVPVWNEGAGLTATLARLASRDDLAEIIVVDGGSDDGSTVALPADPRLKLINASRGRALQMNAGAAVASGDVFLFLHADTRLPPEAVRDITETLARGKRWGRLDVRLDAPQLPFRVIETAMNLRSRLTGIATGDQAIFVTRELFESVGGYAPLPLMEDVDLSRRLKKLARPACLRGRVTTSARRWQQHGILRTVLRMWALRLAFFLGADPARLARRYPVAR